MINVTINDKNQIVTTCDTCEEHAAIMGAILFFFTRGDKNMMKIITIMLATMNADEIKNEFSTMPFPPGMEELRNFIITTSVLSKDKTTVLGQPSGQTMKEVFGSKNQIMEDLLSHKPRFNP